MFDRFTDRARKVMQLSTQKAHLFNHEYIGTEHVLLGLVAEGSGIGATVLKDLGIDLAKVKAEIEKIVQPGLNDGFVLGKLSFTPRVKAVIDYAREEAAAFGHRYVGTEHLLLGLLREQNTAAYQVLLNLGLKLDDVRNETISLIGKPAPAAPPPTPVKLKPGTSIHLSYIREDGGSVGAFMTKIDTLQAHVDALRTGGPLPPDDPCECPECSVSQEADSCSTA